MTAVRYHPCYHQFKWTFWNIMNVSDWLLGWSKKASVMTLLLKNNKWPKRCCCVILQMLSSVEKWTCFLHKRKGENTQNISKRRNSFVSLSCDSDPSAFSPCVMKLPRPWMLIILSVWKQKKSFKSCSDLLHAQRWAEVLRKCRTLAFFCWGLSLIY